MVNKEIEAKRKELEDKMRNAVMGYNCQRFKDQLNGFNLGVEMAQKEFIEWCNEEFLKLRKLGTSIGFQRIFSDKSYSLRKELGEKTK